jgi:ACS family hexuronate transporter-like MFS transporter
MFSMKNIKGLRWLIIGLIGIATIINYIDRSSLAIMWPGISRDLHLNKDQYAAIVAAFMIAYGAGQAVTGRIFDRVGIRIGFVLSICVWSAACMLHGAARGILSFSGFRGLLGLSEAGNFPGGTKASGEWFPIKERALAQGIFNTGSSLGAVISAPLVAALYVLVGWKAAFIVIGCLGMFWIIPWWILYRSGPATHPWMNEEERLYITAGQKTEKVHNPSDEYIHAWGELLTYKQSWSVIASRFFLDPIWWLFVNWLPIYLVERFGFDIRQIGLFAWVPYLGGAVGSIAGGWWSGHMIQKGWSVDKARKWSVVLGGTIMIPAFLLTAFANSPLLAVVLMAAVLGGFQVAMNNIQTLPSDYFSGRSVGSLAGLGGMSAVLGVLVFSTWLIPVLSAKSYTPVFIMGALLVPMGVLSIFIFGGEIKSVEIKRKLR